jgi:hypothetical protein
MRMRIKYPKNKNLIKNKMMNKIKISRIKILTLIREIRIILVRIWYRINPKG